MPQSLGAKTERSVNQSGAGRAGLKHLWQALDSTARGVGVRHPVRRVLRRRSGRARERSACSLLGFAALFAALLLPLGAEASSTGVVVNTTSDVADFGGAQQVGDLPGPDGKVSLREAITAANNTPGPQVIGFAIPASDPGCAAGVCTIRPVIFVLPPLADDRTTIDGSTQTSFAGNPNPAGPEIEINFSLIVHFDGGCQGSPGIGSSCSGLYLASNGNRVHHVVVNGFVGNAEGVRISGSGNVVTGSYIGLDPTGAVAVPNDENGVSIDTGPGNRIGGRTTGERNVISGNQGNGISLASDSNVVEGNFIGTDRTGSVGVGNGGGVIVSFGASENVVGGLSPQARNIISGNDGAGVYIGSFGGASRNIVIGNFLGTDVTGTVAIGNGEDGVRIVGDPGFSANENRIIGNLVAWNSPYGVGLFSANDNVVQGNVIDRNVASGVSCCSGPSGPTSTGNRVTGNVLSRNGVDGITLGGSSGMTVEANLIIQNPRYGVWIGVSSTANIVRRNQVRANGIDGILLEFDASGNSIVENFLRANVEHDCHDNSTGSGTAGTANTWRRNNGQTSQPPGLCVPRG